MQESFEKFRVLFYAALVGLLFLVAVAWALFFSTTSELQNFFPTVMKGFAFLGLGFFFFVTKFPERRYNNYFVHIFLQGHIWWHVCAFTNGYINFWLLFEMLRHTE